MNQLPQISVLELNAQLSSEGETFVLDVREAGELAVAPFARGTHIPMMSIPARVGEIPGDKRIHVLCHIGGRSAQVTMWLNEQGYDAVNVRGGIDAWSTHIDPSVPRY